MGNCVNIDAPVSRGTPPPTDWRPFCLNVTSSFLLSFLKKGSFILVFNPDIRAGDLILNEPILQIYS